MHEPTNPLAESPYSRLPDGTEGARMESGQVFVRDMPARTGGTAGLVDKGHEKVGIHPQAPERIYGWRDSQMSIARFYGGLRYMGHSYSIAPTEEGMPLVRDDVLKRETKAKYEADKAARTDERRRASDSQGGLL